MPVIPLNQFFQGKPKLAMPSLTPSFQVLRFAGVLKPFRGGSFSSEVRRLGDLLASIREAIQTSRSSQGLVRERVFVQEL